MSDVLKRELPKFLKQNKELKLLEIGCGSGINLRAAKKAGVNINNILGSDINEEAIRYCKSLGFNCILSDLFEAFKGEVVSGEPWFSHKFDVIAFNSPYLPLDKREPLNSRAKTTAGKKGNELIIKFLKQARKYLAENGRIFLITSSLSAGIDFNDSGYSAEVIAEKKLFFEKLSLWECLKI